MDKKQKPKIAGSLSEGELYTGAFFAVAYSSFCVLILCAVALVIVSAAENFTTFLYAAIFPAVCAVLIGYFVFTDAAKRVKCTKCLKDGVRVTAKCEKVMATPPSFVKDRNKYIKICVTFEYKGKTRRILSGKEGYTGKGSLEKAGFAALNACYANREVEVIYSPSRGDVLFCLKNNK